LDYSAGKVEDYAEGMRRVIDCGDQEVGVFKIDGEFYAWFNRCAHVDGPVCQGRIMRRVLEPLDDEKCVRELAYDEHELNIICPWHGWEYNIKTGRHPGNPRGRLRKATLVIEDGEVYVRV
jgi:nitrite reductase/ring-hydroxylating ferredoxin subunit